jgi:hypothetical protein
LLRGIRLGIDPSLPIIPQRYDENGTLTQKDDEKAPSIVPDKSPVYLPGKGVEATKGGSVEEKDKAPVLEEGQSRPRSNSRT